jgi:glycine dehydrogenase
VAPTRIRRRALDVGINFRYINDQTVGVSLNETVTTADVQDIVNLFAAAIGKPSPDIDWSTAESRSPSPELRRTTAFMTHPVFNTHRSETQMMRYIRALERKDIGLDTSMIALGSCTMKLNAATEMLPVTWEHFSRIHPFVPEDQAQVTPRSSRSSSMRSLRSQVSALSRCNPNSGAQGEFAGLMVIRAYHRDRGDTHRDVVLIPASAHGTNPASAAMAGMRVVVVATAPNGNVDVTDLRNKAAEHRDRLSSLMITYPSTHGVFEDDIKEICAIVHEHGGQVYMDGANMNAQVGLTSPASIGADVCHLNLHKTFAIPHGGGGPWYGTRWRRGSSGAVSAGSSALAGRRRARDPRGLGGAMGQRQHPADLVRLHPDAGCDRRHRRDPLCDSQRQLHQGAARTALSRAVRAGERTCRA